MTGGMRGAAYREDRYLSCSFLLLQPPPPSALAGQRKAVFGTKAMFCFISLIWLVFFLLLSHFPFT